MVIEFLINVAITAAGYMVIPVLFLAVLVFLRPISQIIEAITNEEVRSDDILKHRRNGFRAVGILVFFILLFSMMQPSNTYKHSGYDRVADDRQRQALVEARRAEQVIEIRDISRQPDHTRAERQSRFDNLVDYTNRTRLDEAAE